MTNIELQHFGQVDINQLEEYYSTKTEIDGEPIRLDLNFENKNISEEQVETIKKFLDNILAFDIQNKVVIKKDFKDEGETVDYLNFYMEELDEEELSGIIDYGNQDVPKEEQLLSKLRLIRVGLYPDYTNYYGVFDYSIDIEGEPCNQLLVVKTDKQGGLAHITWES